MGNIWSLMLCKNKNPKYYEATKMPLSLESIQVSIDIFWVMLLSTTNCTQAKLERKEYTTMTKLESDLKRMVFNCKALHDRSSEPHRDAEKVRKMVTHHMKERKLNPAYIDPGYASFPTPLPYEEGDIDAEGEDEDESGLNFDTPVKESPKPRGKLFLRGPKRRDKLESDAEGSDDDSKGTPTAPVCLHAILWHNETLML
jgi:hypothetical protein